jgi:hypothetical protein
MTEADFFTSPTSKRSKDLEFGGTPKQKLNVEIFY